MDLCRRQVDRSFSPQKRASNRIHWVAHIILLYIHLWKSLSNSFHAVSTQSPRIPDASRTTLFTPYKCAVNSPNRKLLPSIVIIIIDSGPSAFVKGSNFRFRVTIHWQNNWRWHTFQRQRTEFRFSTRFRNHVIPLRTHIPTHKHTREKSELMIDSHQRSSWNRKEELKWHGVMLEQMSWQFTSH